MSEPSERSAHDEGEVERRLAGIVARFPGRHDEGEIALIRRQIGEVVDAARAMRVVELTNGDEPASSFVPHRGAE